MGMIGGPEGACVWGCVCVGVARIESAARANKYGESERKKQQQQKSRAVSSELFSVCRGAVGVSTKFSTLPDRGP